MFRILFAILLGGTISLGILTSTGSTKFIVVLPWVLAATIILFVIGIIVKVFGVSGQTRNEIREAKRVGRVRAALILSRRQTGTLINEQPQIEFTLLVDRPGKKPFMSTARDVVQMIDLHEVVPGTLLAVAHPYADFNNIHILTGEKVPTPSRALTADLASDAAQLPKRKQPFTFSRSPWVFGVLVLVGAVGAPFLVTPNPMPYVEHLVGSKSGSIDRLDHPFLFEPEELLTSIAAMTEALGHDEVFTLHVSDVNLLANAPESPGSRQVVSVSVQDHRIKDQKPGQALPPEGSDQPHWGKFHALDVNWKAVLDRVPEATEVAKALGVAHPELRSISADRASSELSPIHVTLSFFDEFGSETVGLTAEGELVTSAEVASMNEAELSTYFYYADRFESAVDRMLSLAGAREVISIGNHGEWIVVDAYLDADGEHGESIRIVERAGRLVTIQDPEPVKVSPEQRFVLDDFDWGRVYGMIAEGRRIMAGEGSPDMQPSHILIQRGDTPSREGDDAYARIYLKNQYQESGYLEVYGDGTIGRLSAP